MKLNIIFLLTSLLFILGFNANAADGDPDISEKERMLAVEKKFQNNPKHYLVYVKGLVCSSCAIGIKVHLRKLKGVDKRQLEKGISLDIESQIASIALKDNHNISPKDIAKAIDNAGYEAKYLYQWDGKSIVKTDLE